MTDTNATDTRFAGSIPSLYERYLAPLVFEPYAEDLAARLRDIAAGAVLEVAAGTGVVTRALAKVLPAGVRIVATDLNDAMLQVAASRSTSPAVTWKQADAQHLPFSDAEFDAVVCQFGMMFLPNKVAGYREARRVLAPGRRFVFSVWGPLEDNEVSLVVAQTVAGMFASDPPRFYERTPFGYYDTAVIRAELENAGFTRIDIDAVEKVTRGTPAEAAEGLCKGTPLRGEIEARGPDRLDEVTATVSAALTRRFGQSFDNRMLAYVVTASEG